MDMPAAKRIADTMTLSRFPLAITIVCMGIVMQAEALPWITLVTIIAWTTDCLDGPIARRSGAPPTWIGNHDLLFDVSLATSLVIHMIAAGFMNLYLGLAFFLVWALLFKRYGLLMVLGKIYQALIYGCFIYVCFRHGPVPGFVIIGWLVAAIAITWPRFIRQAIPVFFADFRDLQK
jgi:phosphatidylglycerophosphate synthase